MGQVSGRMGVIGALALVLAAESAIAQDQQVAAAPAAAAPAGLERLYRKAVSTSGESSAAALMAHWRWANALTDADLNAEAEAEFRSLRATLLSRDAVEGDDNILALDARLANSLTRQRRFAEAEVLARSVYDVARARHDASSPLVDEPRTTLATALMKLGRYAEAESLARASYERARALGQVADASALAVGLATIYEAMDRPNDARAILIAAGAADEEVIARILAAEDAGDWPRVEALARATLEQVADVGPETRLRASLLEAVVQQVLTVSPERLPEAEALARADLARDEAEGDRERVAGSATRLARILGIEPPEGSSPARRLEALNLYRRGLSTLQEIYGPDHPEVLSKAVSVAMAEGLYAVSDGDPSSQIATADRIADVKQQVLASLGGDPRDAAMLAMTEGIVRGQAGNLAAGYAGIAEAAQRFQAHALEPARRDQTRGLLQDNAQLFRIQVKAAWRLENPLGTAPIREASGISSQNDLGSDGL